MSLQSYDTFEANLSYFHPSSLSPTDRCPICLIPYSNPLITHETENLHNLENLPFAHPIMLDRPTLLPCNHTIGSICIQEWFKTGSNTCPLDRKILFSNAPMRSVPLSYERRMEIYDRKYKDLHEKIQRLPLRALIKDADEWTSGQTVRMSTLPMLRSLSEIMVRVAFRMAKLHDPTVISIWQRTKWEEIVAYEKQGNQTLFPCTREGESEARHFKSLIHTLATGVELELDGQFSSPLRLLMSKEMGVMFEVTGIQIEKRYQGNLAPKEIYQKLSEITRKAWGAYERHKQRRRREVYLDIVLRAWISRERMLSDLRKEMFDELTEIQGYL